MKNFQIILNTSIVLALLVLTGCGSTGEELGGVDETTNPPIDPPTGGGDSSDGASQDTSEGKALYDAQCASCHGPKGDGNPGISIISSIVNQRASNAIVERMPVGAVDDCDQTCADSIIAWVSEVNNLNQSDDEPVGKQVIIEETDRTYRRASILLRGEVPTAEELMRLKQVSDDVLAEELLELMRGEKFEEFIKRSANDRLLTRGADSNIVYDQANNYYKNLSQAMELRDEADLVDYNWSIREEPLALIAHVVLNDLPYSEILTADYTMVTAATNLLYRSGKNFDNAEKFDWKKGRNVGQSVRRSTRRLEDDDREIEIPHAGILTTLGFNARHPSTATNRNRARAKNVLYHFLGYDIEGVATRDFSDDELSDPNNPTMNNPACTQCHETMDPIAGTFQNIGDDGVFFARKGSDGLDSLDPTYVKESEEYTYGDRWYADVRKPGFYGEVLDNQDTGLRWLAQQIIADERFAEGTVKFWWPAIFGEEFFPDSLSETQQSERTQTLIELSESFRQHSNLKQLLKEMLMTDWFRANQIVDNAQIDNIVYYTGGKRLLTPEELTDKASSLTYQSIDDYSQVFNSLYGGIDSQNTIIRARELTPLMYKVAERVALTDSCKIIVDEFNRDSNQRKLFQLIEKHHWAGKTSYAYRETTSQATRESTNNDTLLIDFNAQKNATDITFDLKGQQLYIGKVEIRDSNNNLVVDLLGKAFIDQYAITGSFNNANNKLTGENDAGYVRTSEPVRFRLDLAPGQYRFKMISWRRTENRNLVTELSYLEDNDAERLSMANNQQIAQQIQVLVERMHGETLPLNSRKIQNLLAIFDAARSNKIARGSHNDIRENDQICRYSDPERRRESEWGADPYDTLEAWKVVLIALMSSYDFIYE